MLKNKNESITIIIIVNIVDALMKKTFYEMKTEQIKIEQITTQQTSNFLQQTLDNRCQLLFYFLSGTTTDATTVASSSTMGLTLFE